MSNHPQPFAGIKSVSTEGVCPDKAAAFWVDMVCRHLVQVDCTIRGSCDPFGGAISQRSVAHVDISQVASGAQRVVRTSQLLSQADRDCFLLNIQRVGNSTLIQDGREARLKPGDMVLYSSARRYEMVFDSSFEQTVLIVPADLLRTCHRSIDKLTATTLTGQSPMTRMLTLMTDSCYQTPFEDLVDEAQTHSANGLIEVMVATLSALASGGDHGKTRLGLFHLTRIKQFVIAHMHDPDLSVSTVSKALGISTAHIHRVFATEQMTFSSWKWDRRLLAAKIALENRVNSHRSISELAYDCGFNNMSHFSKVFRLKFSTTPHEWRDKARDQHQR